MNMLTKVRSPLPVPGPLQLTSPLQFESKSNRVKGIAFHPRLTLLAASLHSGSIQLWNFQMGVLVDRFEEHDGQSPRARQSGQRADTRRQVPSVASRSTRPSRCSAVAVTTTRSRSGSESSSRAGTRADTRRGWTAAWKVPSGVGWTRSLGPAAMR